MWRSSSRASLLPLDARLGWLRERHALGRVHILFTAHDSLEDLFGTDADRVVAEHGLVVDDETRLKLLAQIGAAMGLVHREVEANAEGDWSVEFSNRFPAYAAPAGAVPPAGAPVPGTIAVSDQIERWRTDSVGKRAPPARGSS